MDRRSFFRSMIGGVAASAAVRTWPFRVFSFPQNIAINPFALGGTLLIDSELFTLKYWDPQRGRLIAVRGNGGLYEIPLPPSPPYKIIESYVKPADGIMRLGFDFEEVEVSSLI